MRTPILILAVSLVIPCGDVACQSSGVGVTEEIVDPVPAQPTLIGGLDSLLSLVEYPDTQDDLEGTVFVEFIVGEDGRVYDERVVRGLRAEFDSEALRVARLARFHPFIVDGDTQRVKMTLPVQFSLSRSRDQAR